ncbi:hypothetical protein Q5H93_00600 [Hymenobacter sp. ASUV-10]|uniref:Copper amine oxidase N-terminal domain-containing protein n=1 Tax=Hymenobacter aranciens TaxID=3063996 RepID=A0ABT9B4Z3_9BACT|nr:hypothetical protein [Hymenobacter sp. ASUV-10]MDO7873212.1 hypothetical protein [Hymenobacter sp. ASUV-10]
MEGPLSRASRLLRWFVRPFAGQEPSFYRAVTACLLASGLFWQMNALNKTYTTRLNFPLRWHYDTAQYVPLRPLPSQLPVTVTGRGWRLLRANLGWGVQPAELRPKTMPGTRYLPAKVWRRALQTGLEGLEVNESASDTLRLTFDRYATRRLPLTLSQATADSAQTYTARFTPSVLTFRGPSSVISQLPNPYPIVLVGAPADPDENLELAVSLPALVRASARFVLAKVQPRQPDSRRGRRNRRGISN